MMPDSSAGDVNYFFAGGSVNTFIFSNYFLI